MERLLLLLPARPQPLPIRWGATTCLVRVFLLLWLGARHAAGAYGFVFFIPPILIVAIGFDRGSGVLAIALSIAAMALFVDWRIDPAAHVAAFTLFAVVALFVALVGEGMRSALERQRAAQGETELLLQELGHRIKNELAIASSMLALQMRTETDARVRTALEVAVARLHVLAKSHDHLRATHSDQETDMQRYLGEICWNLAEALRGIRPIAVEVDAEKVFALSQKATRIGLIVNELVTNALKHAFPGDASGTVRVNLRRNAGELVLIVEDDGIGCAEGVREGLGSRLTRLLVQQLGGTMARARRKPGCRVSIVIPARNA